MVIGDAARTEKEAVHVHEAIVHDVVVHPPTRHCGVIIRDHDLAPDLVRTTNMCTYVPHGNNK